MSILDRSCRHVEVVLPQMQKETDWFWIFTNIDLPADSMYAEYLHKYSLFFAMIPQNW